MHEVFLGIGSNVEPETHVRQGLDHLADVVGFIRISSVFHSDAIGFDGDPFLNLAVEGRTTLPLPELHARLREIEYDFGRTPDSSKFSSRVLDVDILTFDDLLGVHHGIQLPRPETTENAFVLAPMAEIAPQKVLPGQRRSLAELWEGYARDQRVERIEFEWRSHRLPMMSDAMAGTGLRHL